MSDGSPTTFRLIDGTHIDLLRPERIKFDIEHIATALSRINRYCGHTRFPYSVAQHCCLCMDNTPVQRVNDKRLAVLMHDAAEAYLGDVTAPLKGELLVYREIEDAMQRQIDMYFGISTGTSDSTQRAREHMDAEAYANETRFIRNGDMEPLPRGGRWWQGGIDEWSPDEAAGGFLSRFYGVFNDLSNL